MEWRADDERDDLYHYRCQGSTFTLTLRELEQAPNAQQLIYNRWADAALLMTECSCDDCIAERGGDYETEDGPWQWPSDTYNTAPTS